MSILIPTMEMPTGCAFCPINIDSVCMAMPEQGYDDGNGVERRENCPLVEVVRCKDCKYADWYKNGLNTMSANCLDGNGIGKTERDFCSRGEREYG